MTPLKSIKLVSPERCKVRRSTTSEQSHINWEGDSLNGIYIYMETSSTSIRPFGKVMCGLDRSKTVQTEAQSTQYHTNGTG